MNRTDRLRRLALLKQLQSQPLHFPAFEAGFNQLVDILNIYEHTGLVQSMLILGETGEGKTTLVKTLMKQFPTRVLRDRDIHPIVYATVPSVATIWGTASAILSGIGDPFGNRDSASSKTSRLRVLFKQCGVRMLILDEAQHLYDRGRIRSHYHVSDWIKELIDQLDIPTILVGLPRTKLLLEVNEQLRRRCCMDLRLSTHFTSEEVNPENIFQLFLGLCQAVDLELNLEGESWQEYGFRLAYASEGRVGYLYRLLTGVLIHCHDIPPSGIGLDELAKSFAQYIWSDSPKNLNPFLPNFAFRRLNRAGEPFSPGGLLAERKSGVKV